MVFEEEESVATGAFASPSFLRRSDVVFTQGVYKNEVYLLPTKLD